MDIIDRFYRWALENRWTVVLSTSDQDIDIRTHPILKGYSIDTGSAYWRFINRFFALNMKMAADGSYVVSIIVIPMKAMNLHGMSLR